VGGGVSLIRLFTSSISCNIFIFIIKLVFGITVADPVLLVGSGIIPVFLLKG
jgi:hypothetical protein